MGDYEAEWGEEMRKMTLEEAESTGMGLYQVQEGDGAWKWVFRQAVEVSKEDDEKVPLLTELPEEPMMGAWERLLLKVTVGREDVWRYAEANAVVG